MTMDRPYVPAAGKDAFLPLYDPITRLFGFEAALTQLARQAELQRGAHVLDVGCGTGTLAVLIARTSPGVDITGLDPDPKALDRARHKASRAGVTARFERGFGDALPFPDATFDRVFSSMMFHHLSRDDRAGVLAEVLRVLKPGGRLEFLDFAGGSHNLLAQIVHGRQLDAAAHERLLRRMTDAGFTAAQRTGQRRTAFGVIAYYQAVR